MKRSPIALVALAVGLLGLSLVSVVAAHTLKHDSTVTLHLQKNGKDPDSFAGKVLSDSPRCERNRTVKVFRRLPGDDKLIGTSTTDADGNFELTLAGEAKAGTYYAVAPRKVLREDADHLHVCRRATSNDLELH
jgi:hypothetical protein